MRCRRSWTLVLLLFTLLLLTFSLARVAAAGDNAADESLTTIESRLPAIRALKFTQTVPLKVESRDEVARMFAHDLTESSSDEKLDAEGKVGVMLGLYPRRIDLRAESVKLMKSQVAAFYDSRRKRMVLIHGADVPHDKSAPPEVAEKLRVLTHRMIVAHELTHALQDQQLGLGDKIQRLEHLHNADAELAFRSVVEGDATLSGFAYAVGVMNDTLSDVVTANLEELPQVAAAKHDGAPDGMTVPFLFQYSSGTAFVREAYRRGGWDRVNELYRNPPQSTQQIMDPALYFDHPTPPVEVKLRGFEKALTGWKPLDEDTLGELTLNLIMRTSYGQDSPYLELANGWAGDRIVILKQGKDVSALWLIAFRDTEASARFAGAYRTLLDKIDSGAPHALAQSGQLVLIAVGPAAVQSAKLTPAVWQSSEPHPLSPAPPETHSIWAEWFGGKRSESASSKRQGSWLNNLLADAFSNYLARTQKENDAALEKFGITQQPLDQFKQFKFDPNQLGLNLNQLQENPNQFQMKPAPSDESRRHTERDAPRHRVENWP